MLFRVNANRRRRDRGGLGPRNARREKRERSRNTQSTKKSYINRAYTTCSTGKSFELCYQCTQSVGRGATGPLSGALGPSTQIETSTRQHNKSLKQENRNKKSEQRNSKQHSNRNRVPGSPSDNISSSQKHVPLLALFLPFIFQGGWAVTSCTQFYTPTEISLKF